MVYFYTYPNIFLWDDATRTDRDALYGTHEYQEHLREIGSDLCVL